MRTVSLLDDRGMVLKRIHTTPHEPGRMVEETLVDLDPVFDRVKYLLENHKDIDGMKIAAVIPPDVVERMMRDGSWNDAAAVKRWANDPANSCFRVWKGRL